MCDKIMYMHVLLFNHAQSVESQTVSSQTTDFDPQTQSQTIPISSTPYEDAGLSSMHPPRWVHSLHGKV